MKDTIARGMVWYIFKLEWKGHPITHTNQITMADYYK